MWSYIEKFAEWLKDLLLYLPKKWWADMLDALAGFLESLPVPDFVIQAQQSMSGIPSTVLFFAGKFAIAEGVAMILAALLARFLLRRIPLIG